MDKPGPRLAAVDVAALDKLDAAAQARDRLLLPPGHLRDLARAAEQLLQLCAASDHACQPVSHLGCLDVCEIVRRRMGTMRFCNREAWRTLCIDMPQVNKNYRQSRDMRAPVERNTIS